MPIVVYENEILITYRNFRYDTLEINQIKSARIKLVEAIFTPKNNQALFGGPDWIRTGDLLQVKQISRRI
jgi:hypothetical protein